MARLNDCIKDCPSTGPVALDMTKALKLFTKRCFISKYSEEYRLYRVTHKRMFSMKVTISEEDAKELIEKLQLVEHKSGTFKYGSTFLMKDVSPNNI
jgi:hypothetical protein